MKQKKLAVYSLFCGALSFAFLLVVQSCNSPRNRKSSEIDGLIIDKSKRWPSNTIPVCWENGSSKEAIVWKRILQEVLTKEFGKTPVKFTGWDACEAETSGVRIEIYGDDDVSYAVEGQTNIVKINGVEAYRRPYYARSDGHPRSIGFGKVEKIMPANVILNFRLSHVNENLTKMVASMTEMQKANLLKTIALHEMGHRIGLYHEQSREDSACTGEADSNWEPVGAVKIGPDDPKSVMNYCLTHYHSYDSYIPLSAGDVKAIQALFKKSWFF